MYIICFDDNKKKETYPHSAPRSRASTSGQTKGEDAAAAADDDDDAVVVDEDPPTLDANPFAVLVKKPIMMTLLKRKVITTPLECFMDLDSFSRL